MSLRLQRIPVVAASLAAATLVLLPAGMLISNIANGVPPTSSFTAASQIATQFVSFDDRPAGDAEYGKIVLSAGRFVPSERSVDVQLRVYVPDRIKRGLVDARDLQSVLEGEGDLRRVKSSANDLAIELNMLDRLSGQPRAYRIPLRDIFGERLISTAPDAVVSDTFIVPGQPELFPHDWYWLNYYVSLRPIAPLVFRGSDTAAVVRMFPLDTAVQTTGASHRVLLHTPQVGPARNVQPEFNVLIVNDAQTRLYVYVMALVPLVLVLLLVYKRRRPELMEAAAVMFSVLPLRQVLVPSEIPGITRVDLILAIAVGATAALAIFSRVPVRK